MKLDDLMTIIYDIYEKNNCDGEISVMISNSTGVRELVESDIEYDETENKIFISAGDY